MFNVPPSWHGRVRDYALRVSRVPGRPDRSTVDLLVHFEPEPAPWWRLFGAPAPSASFTYERSCGEGGDLSDLTRALDAALCS